MLPADPAGICVESTRNPGERNRATMNKTDMMGIRQLYETLYGSVDPAGPFIYIRTHSELFDGRRLPSDGGRLVYAGAGMSRQPPF